MVERWFGRRGVVWGQAEMPVHLLKFESWNVKAHA